MRQRDRERRPGRRPPQREVKPIILVVCEGENTEPQYFKGFRAHCQNPRVDIEISDDGGCCPKTLVQRAKKHKKAAEDQAIRQEDDNIKYDSVWCVFDIDDHPNVPSAIEMAEANGIEIAVSNPCFELWLILHFRESPGMQHRDTLVDMLGKYVPGYSHRNKHIDFKLFADKCLDAATRAKRLDDAAEEADEARRNPTTGVHRLTKAIQKTTSP